MASVCWDFAALEVIAVLTLLLSIITMALKTDFGMTL